MPHFTIKYSAVLPRPHQTWPLVKRFWPFMQPYKRTIVAVAVLMIIGLPISVVAPLLVKYLIDTVVASRDTRQLFVVGGALIGLTLLGQGLSYWQMVLNNRFHLLVLYNMRRRLFAHLLRLPMSFYTKHDTGYIMSRQRDDLKQLSGIMADTFLRAAINVIRVVVFIGLLFYIDVALAASGLILAMVFFGANLLFSRPLRRRNEAVQEAEAKTSTALHEGIIGFSLIKATTREKAELRRYVQALSEHVRASFRRDLLEIFSDELIGLAATVGAYFIVLVGAYRIMQGGSTFGNLFAFFMYLTNVFGATGALMRLNSNLQRAMNALQRTYEVLDTSPEPAVPRRDRDKPSQCEIVFDNVSFNYMPDMPVLQNVSAKIPAGAQVALVGPSGAGKTTFAHLIPRFYEPIGGRILLNGKDLRDVHLHDLRRLIGVVPQDVFLFDRTIRDNIAYGNHVADPADIERAARAANAHDFIAAFPDGYESKIGERGIRLSGGQKQRLAIAREILRNPPILILDEATSSLDSAAEALIQEALQRFKKNRTSIIIAHRLSTVIEADWILVFDKGRIVEQGRHEQLLAQGGFYAFLFETQFKRGLVVTD
ncbi:ABC transporter ATP-binding protein/permease [candidate division KSB1 bacterium]|nr:ABC transporter ATP-binding protein/permease [candidate division KSB1 bacterium]